MALTVSQAFPILLDRLVPLETDRKAKADHRASVEASLRGATSFNIRLTCETGSFTHGTGIRGHCDVDLLASIGGTRPASSDTALGWVKDTLAATFWNTAVVIRRPTVVVLFAGGEETWEILPAFRTSPTTDTVYDIPGAASGWMSSAPTAHLDYVTAVNQKAGLNNGAKKLARLAKAWKYYNNVPISSFYLEMRAAEYMNVQTYFDPATHLCRFLEWLNKIELAQMNDPAGKASRFSACSSEANHATALSNLNTAATRASKALNAQEAGSQSNAFDWWNLLFNKHFPAR
jgi:hypothetical protein